MWTPDLLVTDDVPAESLRIFEEVMRRAVEDRGRFAVALSGGSTPLPLFRALARRVDLPWDRAEVIWGDERFVPPEHPDSNARAAREAFLDALPLPPGRVHPWPILDTPEASARRYADLLEARLGADGGVDLCLLGLGGDGHTASLFPGTGAARATGWTVVSRPASQPTPRLSLTAEAIGRSRVVAFLVAGEEKRAALEASLAGSDQVDRHPARAIAARERLLVVTDLRGVTPRPGEAA